MLDPEDEANDEIRNAFQEYIESDDYKDNMELHKVFDDPQGALWCAFIAGWEARKEKETHTTSYTCKCGFVVAVGETECMNCKKPR